MPAEVEHKNNASNNDASGKRRRFRKGSEHLKNNDFNNKKDSYNKNDNKQTVGKRPEGLTKDEYETLKRRNRRAKLKARKLVCFHCRNRGHGVQECPRLNTEKAADGTVIPGLQASGICYRCGSVDHTLAKCPKPATNNGSLPFAECFVCGGKGHLSSMCEKNDLGMYPTGGCCNHCGSVRHLAKDCELAPHRKDKGEKEVFAVMETGIEGGDDDAYYQIDNNIEETNSKNNRNNKRQYDSSNRLNMSTNKTGNDLFAQIAAEKNDSEDSLQNKKPAVIRKKRRVVTF